MVTIDDIIARWNSGEGKPYKGSLICWGDYEGDGKIPPKNIGCMCAQGQVLHLLCGLTPAELRDCGQADADRKVAESLNISVAHSILLRDINDRMDGAPSIVLTHPEKVIGDRAKTVLAFWKHLDGLPRQEWAARATAWPPVLSLGWEAARAAAWDAAGFAARDAALGSGWDAAAWASAWGAARAAGGAAGGATREIQGAAVMREAGKPFYFLPLFGFASPDDIPLK